MVNQDEDEEAVDVPCIPWPLGSTLSRPPPFVQGVYLNG